MLSLPMVLITQVHSTFLKLLVYLSRLISPFLSLIFIPAKTNCFQLLHLAIFLSLHLNSLPPFSKRYWVENIHLWAPCLIARTDFQYRLLQGKSSVSTSNPHQHASNFSVYCHFAIYDPDQALPHSLAVFPKQN